MLTHNSLLTRTRKQSPWQEYFSDAELKKEIMLDVERTDDEEALIPFAPRAHAHAHREREGGKRSE